MKHIKTLALLLCLALCIGAFAGCSESGGTASPTAAPTAAGSAESEPPEAAPFVNTMPITDEVSSLDIWAPWGSSSYVVLTDWNDVAGYQAIEKETNVHVNWTIPAYQNESEAFNLLMASQEYPDIIEYFGSYYSKGLEHAIDSEIIIGLNDVIDKWMPSYMLRLNEYDNLRNAKTDSGVIAAVYCINAEPSVPWGGQVIRQDWLDDLGLNAPATYDELHEVLAAFRDEKGSTMPMELSSTGDAPGNNMSGGFGAAMGMFQKDGKVYYGPATEGFKEYLTTMNAWYEEGLIDKDFPSNSIWDPSRFFAGKSGYGFGFMTVGTYAELQGKSEDVNYNAVGLQNPVKNRGDVNSFGITQTVLNSGGSCITTACENVELAARWMDYAYSEEGSVLICFGIEGTTFFYDENGEPTLDSKGMEEYFGLPYSQCLQFTSPVNHPFYHWTYRGSTVLKSDNSALGSYSDAQQVWAKDTAAANLPAYLSISAEESSEYASAYADIETYVLETTLKMITGVEPIDSAYAAMQTQLEGMGLARCIEIQQNALDRYYAR